MLSGQNLLKPGPLCPDMNGLLPGFFTYICPKRVYTNRGHLGTMSISAEIIQKCLKLKKIMETCYL